MITTAFILALSLGTAADPAPVMRVRASDLDLSDRAQAAVFADRVARGTKAFCAEHIALITPEHIGNPRVCERGMAREAVRGLGERRRLEFQRVGGRRMLARLQRQNR